MGASTSSSSAAATSSSSIPTDKHFSRGKMACRFLMISNCALAVYIITRPRKERSKNGSGGGGEEGVRDVVQQQQQQQLVFGDGDGVEGEVRMEEH